MAFIAGFPAYVAFGQGGSHIAAVTVTATPNFVTAPGGGGGGGGEPEVPQKEQACPAGEISAADRTTTQGLITKTIVVKSVDEHFQLFIDKGIVALTSHGAPLGCIGIHKMETLPPPPEDAYLISGLYDAVPDRATFSPLAVLEYTYEPSSIPPEADAQRLVIASYDEASGTWTALYSLVNTEAHTITAAISRFNDLAVLGYMVEAPPPAAFQVSSLTVSPTEVYTGEAVNITIQVTNTGGQSASYQVILKINGETEKAKEVVLEAGASTEVSFSISKEAAGIYSVDIDGISGTFEVKELPVVPPAKHFNWWIIGLAAAGAALAALLTYTLLAQKKFGGVGGTMAMEAGKAIRSLFRQSKKVRKKR
jgi:hypothetical protein